MLFPFPLVAQNYSHSHGNPMGMGIPVLMHTSSLHMVVQGQIQGFRSWCQVSLWSIQPFGHSARTSQTGRQTGQQTDSI